MQLQAFLLGSILIVIGMFWWNIYLSKLLYSVTQLNLSYNYIFNQSSQYLFIIKPDGNLLAINQKALLYWDINKQDILGKPLSSAFSGINASIQGKLQDAISQAARGELVSLNIELSQKEDTVSKYDFLLTPITNEKGKITLIVAEVSDSNQAQTEFALQKQLLKTCFDYASIGLAIVDRKWRHMVINNTLADINGKSAEEQIGRTVRETLPKLANKLEAIYQQVQTTNKPVCGIEITGETPKEPGIIRNWEASYFPLPISNNLTAIGCIVLEVTKRKKAETALKTRLKQQAVVTQLGQLALSGIELTTLFEQTTVLVAQSLNVDACKILELLPEGNTLLLRSGVGCGDNLINKATVEINFESQAGYALLSGKPVILDNLNEETRFTGSSLLHQNQYVSGVSTIIPGTQKQPFGVLEAHSSKQNQFSQDDANFVQSVANILSTAITRKQAEDENRLLNASLEARVKQRTQQLEATNKELETFAYSVSHDLRSPIRQVYSFADLLHQSLQSINLSEDIETYLGMILKLTKRASKMIDDLIEFSSTGRFEMLYSTIDMNRLVQEVKQQRILQTHDRRIIWDVESLPMVNGDRTLIRIVWQNLIENAVKYTSYKEIAEISIGSSSDLSEITFFIQDNGVGFDTRYVEKIFGIFQRLHTNEEFEGTGIGLANVQRIIHRHGGRIWVESTVNKGTTFYFSLPINQFLTPT